MVSIFVVAHGRAPERIRTSDPRLRRPLLYPPELLAHMRSRGVSTGVQRVQRRIVRKLCATPPIPGCNGVYQRGSCGPARWSREELEPPDPQLFVERRPQRRAARLAACGEAAVLPCRQHRDDSTTARGR